MLDRLSTSGNLSETKRELLLYKKGRKINLYGLSAFVELSRHTRTNKSTFPGLQLIMLRYHLGLNLLYFCWIKHIRISSPLCR